MVECGSDFVFGPSCVCMCVCVCVCAHIGKKRVDSGMDTGAEYTILACQVAEGERGVCVWGGGGTYT